MADWQVYLSAIATPEVVYPVYDASINDPVGQAGLVGQIVLIVILTVIGIVISIISGVCRVKPLIQEDLGQDAFDDNSGLEDLD